jgi:N-acetylmuramoyl-L-alanine amidase
MIQTLNKIIFFTTVLLFFGCGIFKTELRWADLPAEYYAIPPYAQYLSGMHIVLDPGHGGQGDIPGYKRGPSGAREAEINLRVALFLKKFLEEAGAEVFLTRSDDSYLSLADRADFANKSNADFMLALHHNASDNPLTNYTCIYYHKDANLSPASLDLARTVYFALVEALHLPQISLDGLHSDQMIFPDGFGLLRRCTIPAILIESSFFSNVKEEKRLKKKDYNKREAYGIFLGLARYAAGGIPSARLILPDSALSRSKFPLIQFKLFDGLRQRGGTDSSRLRIFSDDITVRIDGEKVKSVFNKNLENVSVQVDSPLTNGRHMVELFFQNIYKNHNIKHSYEIIIAAPCKKISYIVPVTIFPLHGEGFLPVDLQFLDQDNTPVWDGTEVKIRSDDAKIEWLDSTLTDGKCRVYLYPWNKSDSLWIYIKADECMDSLKFHTASQGITILQGCIVNALNNDLLSSAVIYHHDTLLTQTDAYGKFFIAGINPDVYPLKLHKPGFFIKYDTIQVKENWLNQCNANLTPLDSGIFFGKSIILDMPSNDVMKGALITDSFPDMIDHQKLLDFNFHLLQQIADTLKYAGAEPILLKQSKDIDLSISERIQKVNSIKKGWYLRVAISPSYGDSNLARIFIYPANKQARAIAESLSSVFCQLNDQVMIIESTTIPEIRNTNKTAVAVDLAQKNEQDINRITQRFYCGLKKYYQMEQKNKN